MKYHYSSIKIAKIKKTKNTMCWHTHRVNMSSYATTFYGCAVHLLWLSNSLRKCSQKLIQSPSILLYTSWTNESKIVKASTLNSFQLCNSTITKWCKTTLKILISLIKYIKHFITFLPLKLSVLLSSTSGLWICVFWVTSLHCNQIQEVIIFYLTSTDCSHKKFTHCITVAFLP